MERNDGYYVVVKFNLKMVAHYKRGFWYICGVESIFTDDYFEFIGEKVNI